jgi:hypothetical protein
MRLFILLALLFAGTIKAQTYFASTSTPDDNGTNATSVVSVAPPGSMLAGDLVILVCQARANSASITINTDGGQTWIASGMAIIGVGITTQIFWARFDGTWAADPSVFFSSAVCTSVAMHVFRPDNAASTWWFDQDGAWSTYAAPTSPFLVSQTGQTTVDNDVVALAVLGSQDDNTWANATANWIIAGSAQYRNLAQNDMSFVVGYRLLPTGGTATTDFDCRQATNGGDPGIRTILLFKEVPVTNRGIPYFYLRN